MYEWYIVIVGDFNIDWLNTSERKRFYHILETFGHSKYMH